MEPRQRKTAFDLTGALLEVNRLNPTKPTKAIIQNDLKDFFNFPETQSLHSVILCSGSSFKIILDKYRERTNKWPEKIFITTPVKLMSLDEDDSIQYSYPFCLATNGEPEMMDAFIYDIKEKDWLKHQKEEAGRLPYGNYKLSDLSVNHYYFPLFRLKKLALDDQRDANWFAEGFLDITPNGQRIPRFDEFEEKFGSCFDEGVLRSICEHNIFAREIVPYEPPRSQEELSNRNVKKLLAFFANAQHGQNHPNPDGQGGNQQQAPLFDPFMNPNDFALFDADLDAQLRAGNREGEGQNQQPNDHVRGRNIRM